MSTEYPNLSSSSFIIHSASETEGISLSASASQLVCSELPPPYDFQIERSVMKADADEKKEQEEEEARILAQAKTQESQESQETQETQETQEDEDLRRASVVSDEESRMNRILESTANAGNIASTTPIAIAAIVDTPGASDDSRPASGDAGLQVRQAMLRRMKSLTMADEATCEGFLQDNDYDLEKAVGSFYSH